MNTIEVLRRSHCFGLARPTVLVVAGMLAAIASPTLAWAQVEQTGGGTRSVDFCAGLEDASDCFEVKVKNASSATLMSTVIDQNRTGGACVKNSIRVQKNNTGNNAVSNSEVQEYLTATLNPACAYEVKFNVTPGCVGDTRARIKAGKQPVLVGLDHDCGTLQTYKNY